MTEHPPPPFVPYEAPRFSPAESLSRAEAFATYLSRRRSLREFAATPVPRALIESLLIAAGSAPSGAHKQPWTFCAVSNSDLKTQLRQAAEREEYENYHGRMSEEWLEDLVPFGTDWRKPFLEVAPWLIVVFKHVYERQADGQRAKNYYVNESVGIASGMLLTAIHQAGLVALTHTPSPMNFLGELLGRPANERPFLLIPIGYPAERAKVPALARKRLAEISVFY